MDSSQTNMALAAPGVAPALAQQSSGVSGPNHLTQEAPDTEPHRLRAAGPRGQSPPPFLRRRWQERPEKEVGLPEITQQDSAFVHLFGDLMLLKTH